MAGPISTLHAPPKRTAFGDLSNTARTLAGETAAKDVPKTRVKSMVAAVNARDARVQGEKENSRPPAVNTTKYLSAAPIPAGQSNLNSKPATRGVSLATAKNGAAKKTTAVYCDNKPQNINTRPQASSAVDDILSMVDQDFKFPRHYKSQPQLKTDQPLRRTQSRYLPKADKLVDLVDEDDIDDNVTEAAYEDALEEFSNDHEASAEQQAPVKHEEFHVASHVDPELESRYVDRHHAGATPEPEEYWDEDDDEQDLYDEQGYTTAHSYRSHGDNTTGGVTTLLAPKVTSSTLQELEAARQWVMANMTEEEEQEEAWDTSLVAEYGEEIFEYMRRLEVCAPLSHLHFASF